MFRHRRQFATGFAWRLGEMQPRESACKSYTARAMIHCQIGALDANRQVTTRAAQK
jgi:hypothetical protein